MTFQMDSDDYKRQIMDMYQRVCEHQIEWYDFFPIGGWDAALFDAVFRFCRKFVGDNVNNNNIDEDNENEINLYFYYKGVLVNFHFDSAIDVPGYCMVYIYVDKNIALSEDITNIQTEIETAFLSENGT